MSLEDLEKELYSGRPIHREASNQSSSAPSLENPSPLGSPWGVASLDDNSRPIQVGRYWKFILVFLVVVLVGLAGLAGFYLYQYFTTRDVSLVADAPSEISVGVPFTLSLTVENLSQKVLQDSRVALALPDGAVYLDDPSKRIVSIDLDPLASSEASRREISLVITGASLATYRFESIFSYRYDSGTLSSRFDKKKTVELLARDPVLALELSAPEKVLPGEDFEVNISYQNTGQVTLSGARIALTLPAGFSVRNSDFVVGSDGVVILPDIAPGGRGVVTLSATMAGKAYTFFSIDAIARVPLGSLMYDIAKKSVSVSLSPSPLSLDIGVSGGSTTTYPGDLLSYQLSFSNNSDINLSDVIVSATLSGDSFDLSSVESSGHFDDVKKTIIWTAASEGILKELRAHDSGNVSFRVRIKKTLPTSQLSDKNFSVRVHGEVTSPTVPYSVVAQKTIGSADLEVFVGGSLSVEQHAYFADSSSDIANDGMIPPRVGIPTEYTIHWDAYAFSTDWDGVRVSAFLGPGVRWTGKVKTNGKTVPTYNERTQEIVWDIGRVNAGRGTVDPPLSAVFQISIIPSLNQVGQTPTLVASPVITGTDVFVGKSITRSLQSISTRDISDANRPLNYDRVAGSGQ